MQHLHGGVFRITGYSPRIRLEFGELQGLARIDVQASSADEVALVLDDGGSPPVRQHLGDAKAAALPLSGYVLLTESATCFLELSPVRGEVRLEAAAQLVSPVVVAQRTATEAITQQGLGALKLLPKVRARWDANRHQLLHPPSSDPYEVWRALNRWTISERAQLRRLADELPYRPLISIVVPVFNPEPEELLACIESCRAQLYSNWELCLADDASTRAGTRELLERAAASDERIKLALRAENGHISAASNSALALATGEFVALLDQDDALSIDALLEVARALNADPTLDVLYSDEDKLTAEGAHVSSRFKPGWSEELLLSQMYLGHLTVYRRAKVTEVGGFREGYEGSQDHDLALRVTERTQRIHRIPRVLYHWRMSAASTAGGQGAKPWALDAGVRAVSDAVQRRAIDGVAEQAKGFPGHYLIRMRPNRERRVSIVIPTRDGAELLEQCLRSVTSITRDCEFDICVVDNGSVEPATFSLFKKWQSELGGRFQVVREDAAFNFSRLCNLGAKATSGDQLLLLNSDTVATDPDWLVQLSGWSAREEIGSVGCRLLYPDGTIQHAGVVLSNEWIAQHAELGLPGHAGGYYGRLVGAVNAAAVTGAVLMVKRSLYERLSGFDESLPVAYNDVDFCLRAQAAGLRNILLGHVRVVHHESKLRGSDVAPERKARLEREAAKMREKWGATLGRDFTENPNLNRVSFEVIQARTPGYTLPDLLDHRAAEQDVGPSAKAQSVVR